MVTHFPLWLLGFLLLASPVDLAAAAPASPSSTVAPSVPAQAATSSVPSAAALSSSSSSSAHVFSTTSRPGPPRSATAAAGTATATGPKPSASSVVIPPTSRRVSFSQGWFVGRPPTQNQRAVFANTTDIGATVFVQLPPRTIAFQFVGFKSSRGAAYAACVDCQNAFGGALDIVDAHDPLSGGTRRPSVLFSYSDLDPLKSHSLTLFNLPDARFGDTGSMTMVDIVSTVLDADEQNPNPPETVISVPPETAVVPPSTIPPSATSTTPAPPHAQSTTPFPSPPGQSSSSQQPSPPSGASTTASGSSSPSASVSGSNASSSSAASVSSTSASATGTSSASQSASSTLSSNPSSSTGTSTAPTSTSTSGSNGGNGSNNGSNGTNASSRGKVSPGVLAVIAILSLLAVLSLLLGIFVLCRTRRRRIAAINRRSSFSNGRGSGLGDDVRLNSDMGQISGAGLQTGGVVTPLPTINPARYDSELGGGGDQASNVAPTIYQGRYNLDRLVGEDSSQPSVRNLQPGAFPVRPVRGLPVVVNPRPSMSRQTTRRYSGRASTIGSVYSDEEFNYPGDSQPRPVRGGPETSSESLSSYNPVVSTATSSRHPYQRGVLAVTNKSTESVTSRALPGNLPNASWVSRTPRQPF